MFDDAGGAPVTNMTSGNNAHAVTALGFEAPDMSPRILRKSHGIDLLLGH